MTQDWAHIDNRLHDAKWYLSRDDYLGGFKELRDNDPVHWAVDENYGRSYWFLTRHDHVKAALADNATYGNRHPWSAGRVPRSPKRFPAEKRFELGLEARPNNLDDPMHGFLRRPMNRHFSLPAMQKQRESIQDFADSIVQEVSARGDFDLVEDVAAQMPVRVILSMLGVPKEDWDHLRHSASMYTASNDPRYLVGDDPVATAEAGLRNLVDYAMGLAEERKTNPQDDFATIITEMKIEGEPLSPYEVRGWFSALLLGGVETSRLTIGAAVWQLMLHPDQREIFVNSTEAEAGDMIEELIRWISPGRGLLRVAARDVELEGKDIRQGDWVVLSLAGANHDDRAFVDPGRLDLLRKDNDHVGLGYGIHKCIGRHLVRLEVGAMIKTLFRELPDLEMTGEAEWVPDWAASGLATLPMRANAR